MPAVAKRTGWINAPDAGRVVWTGGGRVGVGLAVGDAVRGPVVHRGSEHRHAERAGSLDRRIELLHRRRRPSVLRTAPTDRDDRWLAHGIVHGLIDGVEKAGRG